MHADEHMGDCFDVRLADQPPTIVLTGEDDILTTTIRVAFFGLLNGGPAGLVWGYFWVWFGYLLVFASVAEMASM